MTQLENVRKDNLERALKEIRRDGFRLSGLIGIGSGDTEFWLRILAWIGLTQLLHGNLHMDFVVSVCSGGGITFGLQLLRARDTRKRVDELMKEALELDTEVDLS